MALGLSLGFAVVQLGWKSTRPLSFSFAIPDALTIVLSPANLPRLNSLDFLFLASGSSCRGYSHYSDFR
jgi:hypothetical protein